MSTNETLVSNARTNGISEAELSSFNFGTTVPAEVNWYLLHRVGCAKATHDGHNWMFTSNAVPGIIYIPPKIGLKRPGFPPSGSHVASAPFVPDKPERSNIWFGIAEADAWIVGYSRGHVLGYVVSLDDMGNGMRVWASVDRLGPGLGATGGITIICITGIDGPFRLNGYQQFGGDFNLALGPNWGKIAQGVSQVKKFAPLIELIAKTGVQKMVAPLRAAFF